MTPAARAGVTWLAGVTLLLAACGGGPPIRTDVLAPAPTRAASEFFVEKSEVRSRETGEDARSRAQAYGRSLTQALRDSLTSAGKRIVQPPALVVRSRLYVAWEDPALKSGVAQGDKARVEILLQVVDPDTRAVLYSTLTKSEIAPKAIAGYEYGEDRGANIDKAITQAVQDFVSRL